MAVIILCNAPVMPWLALYLYDRETITGDEFIRILNAP